MTVRDLQKVYPHGLNIYHHIEQLYTGYNFNIPERLLDKEIIELDTDFNSELECSWIEVYI